MKIRLTKKADPQPDQQAVPGGVTKYFLDSIGGNITRHGIKVMADGRQWVLHCISGEPIERYLSEPFRDSKGNIFWKFKGEKISPLDRLTQYSWKNPDQPIV